MRLLYLPENERKKKREHTQFVFCQGYDLGQPLEADHGIRFAYAAWQFCPTAL